MLRIYNTLSTKEEPFPEPEEQKKIRLFVCGPTVYDYLHIGNARTYIFFDFFAKYLRSQGYDVNYLQNITDIDDKIIKRAAEENKKPEEIAKIFTEAYFEDMKALGVDAVSTYAPATEFITQIVAQVERLTEKGFAYKIESDGWYFDISKDEDYGKLSHRTALQAEDSTSRIDEAVGKRNKGDFALWKFSKPGEPSWHTKLGAGRPGWHIEDTAISEFHFGPQYEIHGGGVDLKFPHHEAEIAQQESASGKIPFVKLWMHVGALLVEGKKMSKSLGNYITIRDFLKKYPAVILRYITLQHHYRSPIDFSEESAEQAKNGLENIYQTVNEYHQQAQRSDKVVTKNQLDKNLEKYRNAFFDAMNDDLNTPKALGVMQETLNSHLDPIDKLTLLREFNEILGIGLDRPMQFSPENEAGIAQKIRDYRKLRENKQFTQSDALRKKIEDLGYSVRDTTDGSSYLVKKFFR